MNPSGRLIDGGLSYSCLPEEIGNGYAAISAGSYHNLAFVLVPLLVSAQQDRSEVTKDTSKYSGCSVTGDIPGSCTWQTIEH